jgi:perosamine synthetase
MPLHLHPYYREAYGYRPEDFPVATEKYPELVSLPIFPGMLDEQIEAVSSSIHEIIAKNLKAVALANA